jgi:cytochrome c oxidase subunit 1
MPPIITQLSRTLGIELPWTESLTTQSHQTETLDTAAVSLETRRWITLAVGSIFVAGLLSLAVVIGRLPFISQFIDDPLLFKRCLVVHVDLSLIVWFYAFISGLISMLKPSPAASARNIAFFTTLVGVLCMLGGALSRGAQPVLANYIPVINHPLFLSGLSIFFIGIIAQFILILVSPDKNDSRKALPASLPQEAAIGLQTAAIAVILAGATWISTKAGLPSNLEVKTYFEFSFWGAGHVLQVANVAAMLAVWLWLLKRATGISALSPRAASWAFLALVLPHFIMPILTLRGPMDTLYHSGATFLMRWGIFPITLLFLSIGYIHLRRHRSNITSTETKLARAGFYASGSLTLLGFILGACIRSSTTLVPAHYHASLGGITAAFMAATYLICASAVDKKSPIKAGDKFWKSSRRQLIVYGYGQLVFVLGFAIGGFYGLGRKTYASEQHVRSLGELIGLSVMGIGGLLAAIGGIWFLSIALRKIFGWWKHKHSPLHSTL